MISLTRPFPPQRKWMRMKYRWSIMQQQQQQHGGSYCPFTPRAEWELQQNCQRLESVSEKRLCEDGCERVIIWHSVWELCDCQTATMFSNSIHVWFKGENTYECALSHFNQVVTERPNTCWKPLIRFLKWDVCWVSQWKCFFGRIEFEGNNKYALDLCFSCGFWELKTFFSWTKF